MTLVKYGMRERLIFVLDVVVVYRYRFLKFSQITSFSSQTNSGFVFSFLGISSCLIGGALYGVIQSLFPQKR